eukprot:335070-Amphidinium_carterae.2
MTVVVGVVGLLGGGGGGCGRAGTKKGQRQIPRWGSEVDGVLERVGSVKSCVVNRQESRQMKPCSGVAAPRVVDGVLMCMHDECTGSRVEVWNLSVEVG